VEELDMSIFGFVIIIMILVIIAVLLRQRRTNKERRQENLNPEKTAMVVQRSTKSKVFIIILNSLLVGVFLVSGWCYKDMSQLAANGGEPFGIIFIPLVSAPSLIVLGILLLGFKNRLQIPWFNGLIPFNGIPALYFPLLADIIKRPKEVGLLGVGIAGALSITTVVTAVVILLSKKCKIESSS
jgi:cytochrome c biogenesis factor